MVFCTRIIRAGVHADAGVGTFQLWVPFPVKSVRILNVTAAAANPEATCLVLSSSLFRDEEFAMVTVAVPAIVIPQHVTMAFETPATVNGQYDLRLQLFDRTVPDQDVLVTVVMQFTG